MRKFVGYYFPVTLKGMFMGIADVIPGVSGGTIAFITGIYETLIDSLKSIDADAIKQLLRFDLPAFWHAINGNFLFSLLLGILISIVTLSSTIVFLLEHHALLLLSFFFGLIIASALVIALRVKTHSLSAWAAGLAGALAAFFITSLSPATTPESWWFLFLSGAIAICAMVLPGISGSFILLLLGKYAFILEAIKEFNLAVIVIFGAGCVTGLLGFVRIVSKLLERYHDQMILLLAGIMLGSLTKIWPWKAPVAAEVPDGKNALFFSSNIMPDAYLQATGSDPLLLYALGLMTCGLLLVFSLEFIAGHMRSRLERDSP